MTKLIAFLFMVFLQPSSVFAEGEKGLASDQSAEQKSNPQGDEFDDADLEIEQNEDED